MIAGGARVFAIIACRIHVSLDIRRRIIRPRHYQTLRVGRAAWGQPWIPIVHGRPIGPAPPALMLESDATSMPAAFPRGTEAVHKVRLLPRVQAREVRALRYAARLGVVEADPSGEELVAAGQTRRRRPTILAARSLSWFLVAFPLSRPRVTRIRGSADNLRWR